MLRPGGSVSVPDSSPGIRSCQDQGGNRSSHSPMTKRVLPISRDGSGGVQNDRPNADRTISHRKGPKTSHHGTTEVLTGGTHWLSLGVAPKWHGLGLWILGISPRLGTNQSTLRSES